EVVAVGTPEQVAKVERSHTGKFLQRVIPSENTTPARSEGSRRDGFKVTPRDPSTPLRYAQDHGEEVSLRAAEEPSDRMPNAVGKTPALLPRNANGAIQIHGAREHNLKNIDVAIPRDQMVVITGLSGSGKSTLAFDILFAEGQRRFLDSMSPYARQFVEQLEKPDVDLVEGLPPSVAIEQRVTRGGGKSTVATVTEVYHFLRLLFAKTGMQFCPDCDLPVQKQTVSAIVKRVEAAAKRGVLKVLARLAKARRRCDATAAAAPLKSLIRVCFLLIHRMAPARNAAGSAKFGTAICKRARKIMAILLLRTNLPPNVNLNG